MAEAKKTGDHPPPEEWVDEYGDYLFRYALRHFNDRQAAEELVQETFLAALQAIDRFEGKSTLRTWLTGILKHKIIDRIRKIPRDPLADLRNPELQDSYPFEELGQWKNEEAQKPWNVSPEKIAEQKEFMSVLEKCLSRLPDRMRNIFLLREVDGFNRKEICEQLELTSSNVGVLLHRARLALRECLQKKWLKTEEQQT